MPYPFPISFTRPTEVEFTLALSPADSKRLNQMLSGKPAEKKVEKTQASPASKITVLFNNPATILWKDGKKYVSKAHNEEFDEEKGLLMCLAKANGYTHRDIQKMLKTAKRQAVKTAEEV